MTEKITRQEKLNLANRIMLDKTLSPATRLVGWYIADHIHTRRGYAWPPQEQISHHLGICERSVRYAIEDLPSYFAIDRSQRQHEYHPKPDKLSAITPANNAAIEDDDTGKFFHDIGKGCTPKPAKDVPPSFLDPLKHPTKSAGARRSKKRRGTRQEKAEAEFEEFWQAKPSRGKNQANPKAPARAKFIAAVRAGTDPHKIIAAAKEWARQEQASGNLNSRFVATAVVWLNQKRFDDYAEDLSVKPAAVNGFTTPPGSAAFSA